MQRADKFAWLWKHRALRPWPLAVLVLPLALSLGLNGATSLAQGQALGAGAHHAIHNTQQVITYTYDDAGRLVGANYGDGVSIGYTYDDAGNLLRREVARGVKVYLPTLLKSR